MQVGILSKANQWYLTLYPSYFITSDLTGASNTTIQPSPIPAMIKPDNEAAILNKAVKSSPSWLPYDEYWPSWHRQCSA